MSTNTETSIEPLASPSGDLKPGGQFFYIDPHLLKIGPNRDERPIPPGMAESIAEVGNYDSIHIRVVDGQFVVIAGAHRTRLLCETNHLAKVEIIDDTNVSEKDREIGRIAMQYGSAAHRVEQTEAERIDFTRQMLDLGVPIKRVTELLHGTKRNWVSAVRTARKSGAAMTAATDGQLDIFQAAAAAQFDEDPGAVSLLTTAAVNGTFDHVLQQLEDDRAAAEAAKAEAARQAPIDEAAASSYPDEVARYTGQGYVVAEEADENTWPLEALVNAAGAIATPADITDPIHFLVVLERQLRRRDSDEVVDPTTVDRQTEFYPDDDASPGMTHIREVYSSAIWYPAFFCFDPHAAGLGLPGHEGEDQFATDLSDQAWAEHARANARANQAERAQADRQTASTQRSGRLNKRARSDTKVRRAFATNKIFHGKRKTLPAGAGEFIGKLTRRPDLLTRFATAGIASELGANLAALNEDAATKDRDSRGVMTMFLYCVAAVEAHLQPDAGAGADYWRRPDKALFREYFGLLESLGYPVTGIEKVAMGDLDADYFLEHGDTVPAETSAATVEDGAGNDTPPGTNEVVELSHTETASTDADLAA